jgi:hypothetical protein
MNRVELRKKSKGRKHRFADNFREIGVVPECKRRDSSQRLIHPFED